MKVEILERKKVFDDFLKIEAATLRFQRFDGGMSREVRRLNLMRGDAVAAVVYHLERKVLLLVRQFRFPTVDKDTGWLSELVAGILGPGEDPQAAMRREIEEEMGYRARGLTPICEFFASPGGSDERLFLYYTEVDEGDRVGPGGGLDTEGEDIVTEALPLPELAAYLDQSGIQDAKTHIGLSWFLRHKA